MKNLLVIRLGALGDLIHASPSLVAVKKAHPDVAIHVLTSPAYESLMGFFPAVDRVWTWDKWHGWPGLFRLVHELRQAGIDGVVNLHPSLKTWLLTQMLQPLRQATYRKEKLRIKGQAQRSLSRRHAVADFHEPFRQLLALPPLSDAIPTLSPTTTMKKALSDQPANEVIDPQASDNPPFISPNDNPAVRSHGASPNKAPAEHWIGIIPGVGGKRSNRAWLPESYERLIEKLLTEFPAAKILLIGGPDEQALADRLLQSASANQQDRIENHCGRHDLPGTISILAACDLLIGGDTGPIHLAAALGKAIIGIYGPTSVARTGPLTLANSQNLTPPEALSCWPCEQPTCPLSGDDHLRCMQDIPVETVLHTCTTLLKQVDNSTQTL